MRSKLRFAAVMAAMALSACELLVNTDGLDDAAQPCAGVCGDAGMSEAGAVADAQADGQIAANVDAEADASAVQDGSAGCPTGRGPAMVVVAGLCIDSTEATVADYLTFYHAISGSEPVLPPLACAWKTSINGGCGGGGPSYPVTCVDWCDAYAYCAWAGKRLCGALGGGSFPFARAVSASTSEWSRACSPDGRTYPYGNSLKPAACDTKLADGGNAQGIVVVASLPDCVGGVGGLYDMAGNVEEWIDSCDTHDGGVRSDACHEGGDTYDYAATGTARCDNNDSDRRDFAGPDVGIRCCATP